MPATSEAVTRDIRIKVQARYVSQRSRPEDGLWFFAYHVELEQIGVSREDLT